VPFIDIEGEIPTGLDGWQTYQIYNVLDCAVTAQLAPVMLEFLNEHQGPPNRPASSSGASI
jgi:hypothetical protein